MCMGERAKCNGAEQEGLCPNAENTAGCQQIPHLCSGLCLQSGEGYWLLGWGRLCSALCVCQLQCLVFCLHWCSEHREGLTCLSVVLLVSLGWGFSAVFCYLSNRELWTKKELLRSRLGGGSMQAKAEVCRLNRDLLLA